ncbi:MAG: hypothetical protein AB7I79_08035 [Rhizobiaceae bacterium]
MSTYVSKTLRLVLTAMLLSFAGGAIAQDWPSNGESGYTHDPVTGYLCVTGTCDVVRLPNSDCICTKNNPAEMRLSRLKLTCSTKQGGQWVSCPVKPRYGN